MRSRGQRLEQSPGALVAFEGHRRREQRAPEQRRIAASAATNRQRRVDARAGLESRDQRVQQCRVDARHVAEQDHRAIDVLRQGGNPDA